MKYGRHGEYANLDEWDEVFELNSQERNAKNLAEEYIDEFSDNLVSDIANWLKD